MSGSLTYVLNVIRDYKIAVEVYIHIMFYMCSY